MARIAQFCHRNIIQINVRHEKVFFEQPAPRNHLSDLIDNQTAAVEDQAILPADQVVIRDHHDAIRRPHRGHLFAVGRFAHVIW